MGFKFENLSMNKNKNLLVVIIFVCIGGDSHCSTEESEKKQNTPVGKRITKSAPICNLVPQSFCIISSQSRKDSLDFLLCGAAHTYLMISCTVTLHLKRYCSVEGEGPYYSLLENLIYDATAQLYVTKFSTISLYLNKLNVTQSLAIASNVTHSENRQNCSYSV